MSFFNRRGIFLQKLGPTINDPKEVLVSMQFALKEEAWDAENSVETTALLDSTYIIASSYDGGNSFTLDSPHKEIDDDNIINIDDRTKILALAKAYAGINNP
jgi:hypothetical protein